MVAARRARRVVHRVLDKVAQPAGAEHGRRRRLATLVGICHPVSPNRCWSARVADDELGHFAHGHPLKKKRKTIFFVTVQ